MPIRGQVQLPVAGIIDDLKPFDITLNGKTYNTGPIELTLDPSSGTPPSLTLDFDTMQATLVTDLLVKAPLLKKLKSPPTTVLVTETSTFEFSELKHRGNKVEVSIALGDTTSSGSVSGGPFASALFRNKKKKRRTGPTDCPTWGTAPHGNIVVTLDDNGNIVSGVAVHSQNTLFCTRDDGVLTFADQHISFKGARNGDLAPGK